MDLDDVKGNNQGRRVTVGDVADVYKFPEKKWVSLRFLPGLMVEAGYWVKTVTKAGKNTKFFTPCPSFDPKTQERDSTIYDPWRDLEKKEQRMVDAGDLDKDARKVQFAVTFWMSAISRLEQKKKPSRLPKPTKAEIRTKFKDKESDTWTPIKVVKVGRAFAGKLKDLKGLNTVESSSGAVKAFAVNDVKYGRDVRVLFDDDKAPAQKYEAQLGEKRTPLTEEELGYFGWDLSAALNQTFDKDEVKRDFESWASRNKVKLSSSKSRSSDDEDEEGDDDGDDFDDEPKKGSKKSSKKPVKKSGKKPSRDEEDDDDFGDDDDEDSDGDDDSDDSDEGDDDFDDEPKKPAKKGAKKPVKKGSKTDDDDEDDDLDEDSDSDDDFDDDSDDSDDDSDDEDSDDDLDDDEPKKPAKKGGKKVATSEDFGDDDDDDLDGDDGDDDDSDDDFDDEEDDEPKKPVKKGAKAPAKKVPAKKPVKRR